MKCPKCKKEIENNKCPNCEDKTKNENLDAYLGKLKENVEKDSYSFPCLLGPLYALYYNMWQLGFLWIIIEGLLLFFIPLKFSVIIVITINVIVGFKFNEWFLKKANREIEKIKKNKNIKKKKETCQKAGRPSKFMLVSSILIYILFAILLIITNGKLNKVQSLWMNIPTGFIEEASYGTYQGYKLYNQSNQCYIDITSFETDNITPENYINSQTHEENSEISGLESETINGKVWYKVDEKTKEGYRKFIYATEHNEKIYSVKYTIYVDSGQCQNNKKSFIKSLRF